jgi:hypothetical protein
MVDNDRDGGREALRGYFEFFKHLSTLSTLVLVVVLVLYRDLYLDPVLALVALAAFGVSVLAALASFYGMFVAMDGSFSGTPPRGLLYVAVGGLVGAVLCLIAGIATAGVF